MLGFPGWPANPGSTLLDDRGHRYQVLHLAPTRTSPRGRSPCPSVHLWTCPLGLSLSGRSEGYAPLGTQVRNKRLSSHHFKYDIVGCHSMILTIGLSLRRLLLGTQRCCRNQILFSPRCTQHGLRSVSRLSWYRCPGRSSSAPTSSRYLFSYGRI